MICQADGCNGGIVRDIGETGNIVAKCGKCGIVQHDQSGTGTTAAPPVAPVTAKAAPYAASPMPLDMAKTARFDVLKAAKARLRELNQEIARLQKLTKERDELKRLLDAAKSPKRNEAIKLRRVAT